MTRLLLLAALASAVMAAATVAWLAKAAANYGKVSRCEHVGSPTARPCRHEDTWFDRTLCACGWMHDICADCGQQWPDCGILPRPWAASHGRATEYAGTLRHPIELPFTDGWDDPAMDVYDEPVQPPDPRPVTLASGPPGYSIYYAPRTTGLSRLV